MPLQSFVDGGPPVVSATWLNAIDAFYFTLFNSATTAAAARTALSVYSTTQVDAADAAVVASSLQKTGGTMTGAINQSGTTFNTNTASPDIWTSQGNKIGYTNTTTVTSFPTAPCAGAERVLYCAGAAAFTTGANLLIRGIASGVTVTMKAGATVRVLAITTSQFLIEYSLDGSFTATGTGFTAGVTKTWYYTVMNGVVNVSSHGQDFNGASNTTAFTITGFPAEITPSGNRYLVGLAAIDAGNDIYTAIGIIDSTAVLALYTTYSGAAWTNSSVKGLHTSEFSYVL